MLYLDVSCGFGAEWRALARPLLRHLHALFPRYHRHIVHHLVTFERPLPYHILPFEPIELRTIFLYTPQLELDTQWLQGIDGIGQMS